MHQKYQLEFPGNKKNGKVVKAEPQVVGKYVIYTSMASMKWRVLKNGDRLHNKSFIVLIGPPLYVLQKRPTQ
jgi:hypothetical protein